MINIIDYGFNPAMMPPDAQGVPARVTAVHKDRYELICEHGPCSGRLKTSLYYSNNAVSYGSNIHEDIPAVGDFVLINYSSGESLIIKTLERRSFFSRSDPGDGSEQAIAANFDYVFIIQALNQGYKNFSISKIERYLTAARQSGAMPVIILNKADLVEDYAGYLKEAEKAARGASVYAVSAKTGLGLDMLADYFKPRKTLVFLGSSGVGKSSLVNAAAGEQIMTVNEVRESDGKGKHTTTHRQLIMLPGGVMIIDTPGMRALSLWDVSDVRTPKKRGKQARSRDKAERKQSRERRE